MQRPGGAPLVPDRADAGHRLRIRVGLAEAVPNVAVPIHDGVLVAYTVYVQDFVTAPVIRGMHDLVRQHLRSAETPVPAG
jgi:hypothetical protein